MGVGVTVTWRGISAALAAAVVLSGCVGPGVSTSRPSQGDIALCFYLRDIEWVDRASLDRLVPNATDGQLIGLATAAFDRSSGAAVRKSADARCRTLGAY